MSVLSTRRARKWDPSGWRVKLFVGGQSQNLEVDFRRQLWGGTIQR